MLFAFIMMRVFNVTANLMSLGAIDFGIVVDGSIVILEGILAHIYGKQFRGRTLTRKEMDKEVEKELPALHVRPLCSVDYPYRLLPHPYIERD